MKGRKQGKFTYPYGITFQRNRNIFVADSANHLVQILNREGRFGGKGNREGQLYDPCGLSVDNNGNISECKYMKHVFQLRTNCEDLSSFLTA